MQPIQILLGCEGHKVGDFSFCPGVENIIYTLTSNDDYFKEIADYFNKIKLFDVPLRDYNAIQGFLATFKMKFQSPIKPAWSKQTFENYQKFTINHRSCDLYIRLAIEASAVKPAPEIIPQSTKKLPKLKLVKVKSEN